MLNITQSIMIIDCNGAVSKQFTAPFLRIWAKMFQVFEFHYPLQIYLCYFINGNLNTKLSLANLFTDKLCPFTVTPWSASVVDAVLPFISKFSSEKFKVFGTNKTEWSQELLKQKLINCIEFMVEPNWWRKEQANYN